MTYKTAMLPWKTLTCAANTMFNRGEIFCQETTVNINLSVINSIVKLLLKTSACQLTQGTVTRYLFTTSIEHYITNKTGVINTVEYLGMIQNCHDSWYVKKLFQQKVKTHNG